jgi:hypothetical protein
MREFRLELTPDGRFRYAWRLIGQSIGPWTEIAGKWRSQSTNAWTLEPDMGRASLQAGEFEEGVWPELTWATKLALQISGEGEEKDVSGGMYIIPCVDPDAGLFVRAFIMQTDPRRLEHR